MGKTRAFVLLISCILISFNKVFALEPPARDTIVMSYTADEVVIQAFKQNEEIQIAPISATLLTATTIKDRSVKDIKEISAFVPNLFIPDYGSKMTSPAYIRGIGSRINAPSVGLYVDGVPYFDRSTFDFNLSNVERIEVLRGPQGTIYGRNTMGGVINVYTKSPFKYKESNLSASIGNYGTYLIEGSHYGNVQNKLGYALSANYQHRDGYFHNVTQNKKADPLSATSARVRLSWKANNKLSLHLSSVYEYSDQEGYPYASYNDTTATMADINYNAYSYFRRNMSTTGFNVEYDSDKMRFSSQSSFQYFDGEQGLDQDFTEKNRYYSTFNQRQRMYSQEFNLKSKNIATHEWVIGAFGFYQYYGTNNDIQYLPEVFPPSPLKEGLQDISTPTLGGAIFYQSTINNFIVPKLSLTAGFRYDWEQIKSDTYLHNVSKTEEIRVLKDTLNKVIYSGITPKFALKYTFTNDEIIYASITNGYKSGGFNNTAQMEEHFTFKPESSWSYEVGAKASCLNKLIYTDISLFYIRWNNQQVSQYQPDGKGFFLKNAGKSISKGLEISINANPLENLSLSASYGYTYAKFKEYIYDSQKNIDYSSMYLPMVPKHTFSAGIRYNVPMKNKTILDKISLHTNYNGVGRIYWREDNTASQKFYSLLNGKIAFQKQNISLEIWAKNLTNTDYIAYYFRAQGLNPLTIASYTQRGKPFTFGVDVSVKF